MSETISEQEIAELRDRLARAYPIDYATTVRLLAMAERTAQAEQWRERDAGAFLLVLDELQATLAAANADRARLREALRILADPGSWMHNEPRHGHGRCEFIGTAETGELEAHDVAARALAPAAQGGAHTGAATTEGE